MATSPHQCLPFPLPWPLCLGAGLGAGLVAVPLLTFGAVPQRLSVTVAPTRTVPVGRSPATVPVGWPPGLSIVTIRVFRPRAARAAATWATGFPTYAVGSMRTVAGLVADGVGEAVG